MFEEIIRSNKRSGILPCRLWCTSLQTKFQGFGHGKKQKRLWKARCGSTVFAEGSLEEVPRV